MHNKAQWKCNFDKQLEAYLQMLYNWSIIAKNF